MRSSVAGGATPPAPPLPKIVVGWGAGLGGRGGRGAHPRGLAGFTLRIRRSASTGKLGPAHATGSEHLLRALRGLRGF